MMNSLKIVLLSILLLSIGCRPTKQLPTTTSTVDTNFHLYLLAGQSNMAGRGEIDVESKQENKAILALDSSGRWVNAVDPLHFDKPAAVGVGPGISFAKSILAQTQDSGVRVGLIPCAVGGTGIDLWFAGKQDPVTKAYPYDDAIKRARIAMKSGVLKGILWHQGEANNNEERNQGYKEKLKAVIEHFRDDLSGDYPFVLGEIGRFKTQFANGVMAQVANENPKVVVVSSEGLNHKGDGTHFDTNSARELGVRYAKAIIELVEKKF